MRRRDLLKSIAVAPFALAPKAREGSDKSPPAPSIDANIAGRTYPMPFRHPGVPAGERVEINGTPAIAFVGTEVAISDSQFELLDILVGGQSQFHPQQRTVQPLWPANARGCALRFSKPLDVAHGMTTMCLVVRNTSDQAAPFTGAVFGTAAMV